MLLEKTCNKSIQSCIETAERCAAILSYHRSIWVEDADPKGKYRELTLRPESKIKMHAGQYNRRTAVAKTTLKPSETHLLAVTSTGHDVEVNDEGSLTIMLPQSGDDSVQLQKRPFHAGAGEGLAFGPSRRKLQRVFRRTTGDTIWTYLTSIRLGQARRMLVSGAPVSVTAAAFECGIAHLGRFARQYQDTYGELPGQTLKRAKRRMGMSGR